MRRLFARRPSPAMVVGFVALVAALSGTAVALPGINLIDSGDIKNGQVKGKDIAKNAVTGKKVANRSLTGADVRDGSLTPTDFSGSVQGPAGPKGDKGDPGAPGAPATKLWAVVDGDGVGEGTLIRGSGVVAVSKDAEGQYSVTFNQAVDACAYVGSPDRGIPDRTISLSTSGAPSPAIIRVQTGLSSSGANADANFDLIVVC